MEVTITTGSRLHFGLLDVAAPFGGCGVMIDQPTTIVRVRNASQFSCCDLHRDRIESIADRIALKFATSQRPSVQVDVLQFAPPHTGLGSGTQLSLAIAEAFLRSDPILAPEMTEQLIIEISGRGHRSAVGCHGYFHGGMIVEGVQPREANAVNELSQRLLLPEPWRVVVWVPSPDARVGESVCGVREQQRFAALPRVSAEVRKSLVDCLADDLIPAVQDADFAAFAKAVTQYNHRSGELFAAVQNGPYNGEAASMGIESLRRLGVQGVGQSSWGPGLFGWFQNQTDAMGAMELDIPGYQIGWIAKPLNHGVTVGVSSNVVSNGLL